MQRDPAGDELQCVQVCRSGTYPVPVRRPDVEVVRLHYPVGVQGCGFVVWAQLQADSYSLGVSRR